MEMVIFRVEKVAVSWFPPQTGSQDMFASS